jgi:hypothetical protein
MEVYQIISHTGYTTLTWLYNNFLIIFAKCHRKSQIWNKLIKTFFNFYCDTLHKQSSFLTADLEFNLIIIVMVIKYIN